MSYCRFSCDDFKSDVYVYASSRGGIVTHVATHRYVYPPKYGDVEWCNSRPPAVAIGLQYDGAVFNHRDERDCLNSLRHLKEVGYHVPEHALKRLEEEVNQ